MQKIIEKLESLLNDCNPLYHINDENYISKCENMVIGHDVLYLTIGTAHIWSTDEITSKLKEISIFKGSDDIFIIKSENMNLNLYDVNNLFDKLKK